MQQRKNSQSSRLPGTGWRRQNKTAQCPEARSWLNKITAHNALNMRSKHTVLGCDFPWFTLFSRVFLLRIIIPAIPSRDQLGSGWQIRGGRVVCHCAGKFLLFPENSFPRVTYG
jgi:hypothetical protein